VVYVSSLATGASVKITGEWKESIAGGKQARELLAQEVKIIGEADPEVKHPLPYILNDLLPLLAPHIEPPNPHSL
jgi:aspartyl/asparaginyl-tRNA synthetase